MCCFKTPRAQDFYCDVSIWPLLPLISGGSTRAAQILQVFVSSFISVFFESFSTAEAPQAGIIKLEWWVEANV